jgi:hypothetical protein
MSSRIKTPGEQLKAAREELGKSQSDMAKITRMGIQQLRGIEEDRYDSIPAPMCVRGFMKLYAKNLGLNPEPLLELYERMSRGEPLSDEPVVPAPSHATPKPSERVTERAKAPASAFSDPDLGLNGFSRELPAPKGSTPSFISIQLDAFLSWLDRFRGSLQWDWIKSPRTKIIAGGLLLFFLFLFGVNRCAGSQESARSAEFPEVEDPLLSLPEPVYFELPSSFQ